MPSRSESRLPLPSIEKGKWPLQNHHYDFVLQAFKVCIGHVLELQSATQFSPDTAHPETDDELLEIAAEIASAKYKDPFFVKIEDYFASIAMEGYTRAKKDLPPQALPTLKQLEKSIHSVITERHAGLTRTHEYLFHQLRTINSDERTQLKSSLYTIGRERFIAAYILRNITRFIELLATNHNWDHIQHDTNAVKLDTTDIPVQKTVPIARRMLPADQHRFDD